MNTSTRYLLALLASCLTFSAVLADDPYEAEENKNGYQLTSTYGGFLSSGGLYSLNVNQYTGGYNLHIPILSLAGRAGHDLNITATYNSKQLWLEPWQMYTWEGYRYGFNINSYLPGPHSGRWLLNIWPSIKEEVPNSLYYFTTPDGAVHVLNQNVSNRFLAADGSYIAYIPSTKKVVYPDGSFWDFSVYDTQHKVHHVDRNGNRITYVYSQYSGSLWRPTQIIDTLGREINFVYGDSEWSYVTEIQILNRDGTGHQTLTYELDYSSVPVDLDAIEYHNGSWRKYYGTIYGLSDYRVLTSIGLPNGTGYSITYATDHVKNEAEQWEDVSTYQLDELTLPTGATVSFDYATPPVPTANQTTTAIWGEQLKYAERVSRRVSSVTVDPLDGYPFATTYSFVRDSDNNITQTTETKPDGSKVVTDFYGSTENSALLREVQTVYDTNGTTELRSSESGWADTSYGKRISVSLTEERSALAATPSYVRTERTYDYFGRLTREKVLDGDRINYYYPLRARHLEYDTFDWTRYISKLRRVEETAWNGTSDEYVVQATVYNYDQYALTDRTSPAQHDPTFTTSYTNRGNVTQVQAYLVSENRWITTQTHYDILGNPVQVTDPLSHSTTTTYAAGTNNHYAFPTRVTNALSQYTDIVFDFYTGLPFQVTDPNGQSSTFTYDIYNRLIQKNTPGGGQENYAYYDQYNTGIYRLKSEKTGKITSTDSATQTMYFDGIGRLVRTELEQDVGGPVIIDRQYELCTCSGKVARESMPYRSGEPVLWTEKRYDGLGRVLKVIPPDGSASSNNTEYRYKFGESPLSGLHGASFVGVFDGTRRGRVYVYGMDGDLIEVGEDAKYSDLSYTYATQYEKRPDTNYLTNGRRRDGVLINYARTTYRDIIQGSQTRTFRSDSLGRLVSELHPENGTTSYTYDDAGRLATRTDARNWVTNYSYDNINRPTGRTYSGDGGVTPSATYTYDQGTYGIGHMSSWSSANNVSGGAEFDVAGRTTRQWLSLPSNSQEEVNYTYNLAGQRTSFEYPNNETLTYSYNGIGQLTDLTSSWVDAQHPANLLSSINYNSAGQPDYALLGNNRELRRGYHPVTGQLQHHEVRNIDIPFANAGFESGSGGDASDWSEILGSARSDEAALTGKYSLKLASGSLALASASSYIAVQGSTTYTLSGYLYLSYYHSGNVYIDPDGGNAQGQAFTNAQAFADTSKVGTWQRVSTTFTTAAGTTGVKVRVVHDGGQSGTSAVFYADELSITAGTTAPAAAWTYDYRDGGVAVANSSFEAGSSTNAVGWNQTTYAYRDGARAKAGAYSMKLGGYSTTVATLSNYAKVRGSTHYRLSGWIYISSYGSGNVYLDLNDGNGEGQNFTDLNLQANTGTVGSWQYVTGTFDTAASTAGVKVRCVKDGGYTTTAYFDGIEIREESADFGTPQNGMIQAIQDQVNPNYSETYHYDELYRLDSAETSVWSLSWVYDRYGNRLSQSGSGGVPTETLTISTTTNRVSGWTYDAAGNVTNDGTHTYAYDAENRLISVDAGVTATYAYGPNGERVWKIAGGVTTYYYWGIGEKVSGSWTKFFVSGLGGKLVEYSSSTTKFFVTNHLGSVAARMDVSGTLSETYRYLPFGELFAGSATTHEFTGKERDQESGLDYFGARYLASNHGRWMSVDPVFRKAHDPQSLNRYAYSRNDPIGKYDPNGEEWRIVDCGVADTGTRVIGLPGSTQKEEYYCIYNWYPDAPPPTTPPAKPPTKEQDPVRRIPWKEVESDCISQWAKDLLAPYFPDLDLDSVPVVPVPWSYPGLVTLGETDRWRGITLFPIVFYDPLKPGTDPGSDAGLWLFAHEFTHLEQIENYEFLGREWFYYTYVTWWAWNVFHNGGYSDIGFEEWANQNASEIMVKVREQLAGGEGTRVCR